MPAVPPLGRTRRTTQFMTARSWILAAIVVAVICMAAIFVPLFVSALLP
jgi:hypothetical protein